MNAKEQIEEMYRLHHERGRRYGYLFCHGERGPYLARWIGKGKRVLDLGCRDGMLTQVFARGNQVLGVDIDRKALELIRGHLGIETLWADLNQEWPFEKESFDVIVACEIMEHLFVLESFLDKVLATLKPGGLFIGSVPNAFRVRNRLKFLMGKDYETDPTHVRQFSYQKVHTLLSIRFKEAEIVPVQGRVFPFWPVSGETPKWLGALFAKDLLWCAKK
jgi:2-polyprenyl-3-methyl-5-hydroxy-6-metoxy-1,4-benzoquinol methylase